MMNKYQQAAVRKPMTIRMFIGYLLLVLLLAGVAFAVKLAIYNSDRNIRRRERRARRARYQAIMSESAADEDD
jgi:hypothetical protein